MGRTWIPGADIGTRKMVRPCYAARVHAWLVTAIADGDDAEAERLARAHLRATQSVVLERYNSGMVNAASDLARQAIAAGRAHASSTRGRITARADQLW